MSAGARFDECLAAASTCIDPKYRLILGHFGPMFGLGSYFGPSVLELERQRCLVSGLQTFGGQNQCWKCANKIVNYRNNCFLRMFAGMRSRRKKHICPAWELNF